MTPEVAVEPSAPRSQPLAVASPKPGIIGTSAAEQAQTFFEKATKEQPWGNSLGMKFVPVAGTKVLFSVWDTRVQDFEMFVESTGYDATGGGMYSIGKLYSWDIPRKRDKSWPPPAGAGNYAGEEAKNADWPSDFQVIEGYNDSYPRTSPVGSFAANFSGLYDMGGNVWQWCEDLLILQNRRVLRGGSWGDSNPDNLLASYRTDGTPDRRYAFVGFRCVVAVESSR